ncbi:MAG: holo-ACP synthase [Candidatus Aegiribacteria sp.]
MRLIGVGIDIVDVEVFRSRLDSGMVEELFLPREIGYCSSRARPWESYAARFAAKEAAFKSLGAGLSQGLRWKNVEVVREESGAVCIELSGAALKMAEERNVSVTNLSLSHTRDCAIAIVTMQG